LRGAVSTAAYAYERAARLSTDPTHRAVRQVRAIKAKIELGDREGFEQGRWNGRHGFSERSLSVDNSMTV